MNERERYIYQLLSENYEWRVQIAENTEDGRQAIELDKEVSTDDDIKIPSSLIEKFQNLFDIEDYDIMSFVSEDSSGKRNNVNIRFYLEEDLVDEP